MLRFPNRTAQSGVFHTGSPNYVDLSGGEALAGMVTFAAKATDDSWADGDTVGVLVSADDDNYWVGTATWDETNGYLELTSEEDSVGTLDDLADVTIYAVLTSGGVAVVRGREVLTADRTYYVATDGDDENDGLSAGAPFLTIQHAVDVVCGLDCSIYQVTIQVASGTYDSFVFGRYGGKLPPIVIGDTSNPNNVTISSTYSCVTNQSGMEWIVKGLRLTSATSNGIETGSASTTSFGDLIFGECGWCHIFSAANSLVRANYGNYAISGNAQYHVNVTRDALFLGFGVTVTLSNSPVFTTFASCGPGLCEFDGMVFTGTSASGKRYAASLCGVISVNGAGTTFLPGSTSGTTATGGQYA